MLSLDAIEWKSFEGGFRINYDASIALKKLESLNQPDKEIWNELWEELYHQGDVGIGSYAVIPQIYRIYREKCWVDFQLPSFASAIERARFEERNTELPEWLSQDYFESLRGIALYCLENSKADSDKNFSRAALLLVAILLKDPATYDLLEAISIGEEEKVLEFYYEHF